MQPRTTEELLRLLDEDLAWRKKELSLFLGQVESASKGAAFQIAAMRGAIALLYAHWEGFIKCSAGRFLEFVSFQKPEFGQVIDGIATLAWRKKTGFHPEKSKSSQLGLITNHFRTASNKQIPHLDGRSIDTEANLSSSVLKEILWVLGLDYSQFETKEKLVDEKLLAKRNHIAHGQYIDISPGDYPELHKDVLGMLIAFNNQIQNAAVTKQYLILPAGTIGGG